MRGLWKSGKKEGFRVLNLKKWVMIVWIAGRRQGHDVFIVFFIRAWVNFIWDKPHLIKCLNVCFISPSLSNL